jgi:PIN domain
VHTALFLDTMIYLHYQPVEQVDWPTLVRDAGSAAKSATIVVTRITHRELDKHKNDHRNNKIKERARRVVKQLMEWSDMTRGGTTPEVRAGVHIAFFTKLPNVNFAAEGLESEWPDDKLIAAMIAYRLEHPDADIWLVTQDAGPRSTALDHGFRVLQLPDSLKLPAQEDPDEIEKRELRRRLERMELAQPKLSLEFVPGPGVADGTRLEIDLGKKPSRPRKLWDQALKAAESKVPPRTEALDQQAQTRNFQNPLAQMIAAASFEGLPTAEEYERYGREREQYLRDYRNELEATWESWCRAERSFTLAFQVINQGTSPAADIDVYVHIPDGPEVCDGAAPETYGEAPIPEPPKGPSPPMSERARIMQSALGSFAYALPAIVPPDLSGLVSRGIGGQPANVSNLRIRQTNSYEVRANVHGLKHRTRVRLPEAHCIFPEHDTAASFSITYTLLVANLPDAVTGKLHVVVRTS